MIVVICNMYCFYRWIDGKSLGFLQYDKYNYTLHVINGKIEIYSKKKYLVYYIWKNSVIEVIK